MKGKAFNLKLILSVMLALTAGLGFCLGVTPKQKSSNMAVDASTKVSLGLEGAKEEYSALFNGDVIFSVEKVKVNSTENENGIPNSLTSFDKQFYATYDTSREDETFTFKNIQNGTSNKTVLNNGDFAKLDNVDKDGKFGIANEDGLQEAILVSFGSYVYSENLPVEVSDTEIHAGITYLDVVIKKDGQKMDKTLVPEIRNIRPTNGGLFFDFNYLITQQENNSNEGFYELSFAYMVNNKVETANFCFYLINKTSYTQKVNPDGKDFGYQAEPILGWIDSERDKNFEKDDLDKGYVRYRIGENGLGNNISYPTLTYDYTKYELSYVHTANQKNTTYDFSIVYSQTAGGKTAKLRAQITTSDSTTTKEYQLNDYKDGAVNLVTIMLTEPGTYVPEYKFLYDGYVGTAQPNPVFDTKEIKLSIHGLSTYYSKANFEGAKMQYFEVATQSANNVDLIVPNGYQIEENVEDLKDKKLGFIYKLVESDAREGSVVKSSSIDTLVNDYLKNESIFVDINNFQTYYNYLIENVKEYDSREKLGEILEKINSEDIYAKTNQGSLWLEGNDSYTNNSFYFYSPKPFTYESLFKKDGEGNLTSETSAIRLSNTTTFNSKGYYLVFAEVIPNGLGESAEYWQVFAFQYTSSSVNINIDAVEEDGSYSVVSNGKFTNKDVVISWEKPGIFDRNVYAYYYSVTNENRDKEYLLSNATKQPLVGVEKDGYYYANLGEEVADNTFAKYLVRLESEGESATHKLFTIDRQAISGIQAYLIQEMHSGNSVYYSYATDKNGYYIAINNAVTDGYATIEWDNKASDAKIYATYSYTPFVTSADEEDLAKVINGNGGYKWISTNYKLGTTGLTADLKKADSKFDVSSDCVLFNQGIYIIDLQDDAGNKSRYAFVIDRTENYFVVDGQCYSNASLLYGNNVNFSIGDYKVFDLDVESMSNGLLKEFITKAASNKLNTLENYYVGTNNNTEALSKLFQNLTSENNYYFTIENNSVVAFDGNLEDKNIVVDNGGDGQFNYFDSTSTSYKRTIYVVSANHTYSTEDVKTHSYVKIEINKDNARGSVYYSNDSAFTNVPLDGAETEAYPKLNTGSDLFDKDGNLLGSGIEGAGATSAKHVAFVWNMGTGSFEVETVKYSYYTLNTKKYHANINLEEGIYYYSYSDGDELYDNGTWNESLGAELMKDNSGRGIVRFNRTSDTKAGLYIITRTYKEITGADLGDDVREKNYYFIVDRNGIIETGIGGSIRVELMEGESTFNSFTTQGTDYDLLSFGTDNINSERYNIYLTTTKLPATLNIPTGKYYSVDGTTAKYGAGQLNVSVYFSDRYNQLTDKYKGRTIKIYSSNGTEQKLANVFNIDIYNYLSNSDYPNNLVRDIITESSENGNWLFLPGDYIIRISDNVLNTLGETHVKYIGLRIATYEDKGPEVEIYNGFSEDTMNKVNLENNSAKVSQELLKVVLPSYNVTETKKAQVDKNYIVVDQYVDGVRKNYLYHEYKPDSGIPLNGDPAYSNYVTINNTDDSINVWLDTKLRTVTGEIDYESFDKSLSYTITVRYKLNNYPLPYDDDLAIKDLTKYQNCYVYYSTNGERVDNFYYKTYTITIDREAPKGNIEYLNQKDGLVEEYNSLYQIDSMIENGIHQTNSNVYFTKQYSKYYQAGKQAAHIYIYQVNESTPFNVQDVSMVYVKEIEDVESIRLDLPLIDTSVYTKAISARDLDDNNDGMGVYSGLGLFVGGYYEIVEVDSAGNATQYVIYYSDSDVEVSIPFSVTTTLNETVNLNVTSTDGGTKNIFTIKANGEVISNSYFFKVQLERVGGEIIYENLTNLETNFAKLTQEIALALNNEGFGNFNLKISTISNESVTHIKLYNESIIDSLDASRLVKDESGQAYKNALGKESIYLLGANKTETIEGQAIDFYATEITIRTGEIITTYVADVDAEGNVKYYEKEFYEENKTDKSALRNKDIVYVELKENTTYLISMKDVFGPVSPYRFNTAGYEFVVVEYVDVDSDEDDDFYHEVDGENHRYYGFTNATLKFDTTIYTTEVALKKASGYQIIPLTPEIVNDVYSQYVFNAENNYLVEYRVRLYYNGEHELTYFITIDTRLSSVTLTDSTNGEERNLIEIFNNADYSSNTVRSFKPGTGRLTLSWMPLEENDYFDYDYRLYEVLKDNKGFRKYSFVDGFYVESENGEEGLNLNGKTSAIIATKEDSEGIYKFVISVYGKNGEYLGNRVFAFEVQEVNTQVYYVINANGEEIKVNSSFKYKDLDPLTQNNPIFFRDEELLLNENINLPLYITNQSYKVQELSLSVEKPSIIINLGEGNNLEIFRISKLDAYDIFIGVLSIKETNSIVKDVKVNTTEIVQQTSLTVAGGKTDEVLLQATRISQYSNILAKNKLMVDVYYNGEFINSQEFNTNYSIEGNGQYSFVFRDLAGNVHEYTEDADKNTPETQDKLDVFVLREVVVTLNGDVPIRNAFYNGEVVLSIFASSKYQIGSIKISATRNGVKYVPEGHNPYVFSDYGTYRVILSAGYEGLAAPLTKVVTFTIVNVNEAKTSIDLTGLSGCEITEVLNPNGEVKTAQFLKMLKQNDRMNVSYEDIMEYEISAKKEDKLGVTSGKLTFTLTYVVEDLAYPKREITIKFTLNNETPTVDCSLSKGESSTKGFTISFNAAVIYEQVGESYVYINDRLVAHITEKSENREQQISTTYKNFGDGDYYVKLVSSSGIILDSYKVTIKEPLNTWAIVVIIVVVGAVLTVAITIIVLRRKMRIR